MKTVALLTMLCAGPALFVAGCTETTGTTAGVTATGGVAMPAGLTSEERLIWNSLNEGAKRDAVAYMEAGGTFKEFVSVEPAS